MPCPVPEASACCPQHAVVSRRWLWVAWQHAVPSHALPTAVILLAFLLHTETPDLGLHCPMSHHRLKNMSLLAQGWVEAVVVDIAMAGKATSSCHGNDGEEELCLSTNPELLHHVRVLQVLLGCEEGRTCCISTGNCSTPVGLRKGRTTRGMGGGTVIRPGGSPLWGKGRFLW